MEIEEKVLLEKIATIKQSLTHLAQTLAIAEKQQELAVLEREIAAPDFWANQQQAQLKILQQKERKEIVEPWQDLQERLTDAQTLLEMLEQESDAQAYASVVADVLQLEKLHEAFLLEILYAGEHDKANAYLEIHAGEGGVDAQDFAQMLYRMYVRWAEKNGLQTRVLEYQAGDEAGIKSALLEIRGTHAYGQLKSEHGVHRLIRLSPFDTAKRRHTSFVSISVIPEVNQNIDVQINESDLKIDTYRSSGAGGQSVNTTDSAVRITHLPTGIVVTCQNERSQIQNREQAMKILASKLYEYEREKQQQAQDALIGEKKGIGFGSQIRSYVLHPYSMVKDHRTNYEVGNVADVLDGNITGFIESYLKYLADVPNAKKR